ncbi:hypothetical protein [Paenibacillus camerounensis]|uniref:hypothetical protein n=1 Tax=Paenibacillus camerounensis TaxID=1243663 RepID=UPI0005A91BD1|nr:hypothetical protein [Paenibacillus camerounensis]
MIERDRAVPYHTNNRVSKVLTSEQGSALVLVMFLVLMLTILGMAVLGATIGGAQRTETRENDVQSLHLAQKGLDEATAYIQAQLAVQNAIDPDKLESVIQSLSELNDDNRNITTEPGIIGNSASGTIDEIKYTADTTNSTLQARRYYIDIFTSAFVNGVDRKLKQRITLDSYPEFLKYAFGSEHDLRLNGAPLLKGNIYAGNELIVTQTAEYLYQNTSMDKLTVYPKILENTASKTESGELYVQSFDSVKYAPEYINESSLQTIDPGDTQKWNDVLGITPSKVKIKEQKKFVQIDVLESFWDKLLEAGVIADGNEIQKSFKQKLEEYKLDENGLNSDGTADHVEELAAMLQDGTKTKGEHLKIPEPYLLDPYPENYTLKDKEDIDKKNAKKESDYISELAKMENRTESAVYNGNLSINSIGYKNLTFTQTAKESPKWLVVAGDLDIVNNTDTLMNVKGNVLVAGNVTIKGNVAFDSTMFVLGSTTVEDATIQGLEGKELVLISKGKVLINRLAAFSNNPVTMKAFFYTDSTGELYGVGSRFSLEGGFFAKGDLTVNAVVGEVKSLSAYTPNSDFATQVDGEMRRFEVTYNDEVYGHQQSSLPRVSNVSLTVGPVEFAD